MITRRLLWDTVRLIAGAWLLWYLFTTALELIEYVRGITWL